MEAADTVAEMLELGLEVENCEEEEGVLRFLLDECIYLYCEVNHQNVPMNGETIDWAHVTRLKVVRIGGAQ